MDKFTENTGTGVLQLEVLIRELLPKPSATRPFPAKLVKS